MKEAMYYAKLDNNAVRCGLCPRRCVIAQGKRGFCRVRENQNGTLHTLSYGKPVAMHIDPIEKKPLFHFYPGTEAFSIATAGCNLACKFCQNWQISQASPEDIPTDTVLPDGIIKLAAESKCKTIAYTYSEPTIFYEYMLDTAKMARAKGIKNIMHTAGFINEEPLRELCKHLDAADVDLKGSDKFYQQMCLGSRADVLRTLKILKEQGIWLEITYLVVPTLNDDDEYAAETCKWINDNLGSSVPLHISRFWPTYKLTNLSPTPVSTLEKIRRIAVNAGLKYVYIGNVPGSAAENTYCPKCKNTIIERMGYTVVSYKIDNGRCRHCKEKIEGVWEN
ncbi:MAG: AmmeMemoRadiSam system radical SAM enzyme [Candidatus Omnitrophica bacterium]|nr:AmmeMemoRadiSam system radical SAM enzyme [Candidatus Omnitrophota bacterium]